VILIGEAFRLGVSLRKYPLIYTVLGNSLGFAVALIIFHVIEGAIRAMVKSLPLSSSIAHFGGGTIFGFVTVGVIFFSALIPVFLWNLFFSTRAKTFRLVQD
jgi:hypothetical protein